jgi:hypothetical protein
MFWLHQLDQLRHGQGEFASPLPAHYRWLFRSKRVSRTPTICRRPLRSSQNIPPQEILVNRLMNYLCGNNPYRQASRRPDFRPTLDVLEARDCPSAAPLVNTIQAPPPAQTAQASFAPTTGTSTNWSGYEATPGNGQQVTEVSGTWVEPSDTGSVAHSANSIWVGISESNGHGPIEQAGVAWYASTNSYHAWVECLGDKTQGPNGNWTGNQINVQLTTSNGSPFQIQAGDTITTSVQLVPGTTNTFEFTITATGPNGTGSFSQQYTTKSVPQMTSAEWIVENPNGAAQPLANFGPVSFTNCSEQVGSTQGTIDAFPCHQINMRNSQEGSATTSGLAPNGAGFSVTSGSTSSTTDNAAVLPAAQAVNAELSDFSALDAAFIQSYQHTNPLQLA